MVFKGSEIALGIGIKSLVKKLCDNCPFDLERTGGNIHEVIESFIEIRFIGSEVCNPRKIDGYNADRACAFAAAEEAAGLFAKLAQIKAKTAAHAADIARSHVAVNIV